MCSKNITFELLNSLLRLQSNVNDLKRHLTEQRTKRMNNSKAVGKAATKQIKIVSANHK